MGCVAALLSGQQRVPPDEMRLRNSAWVPPVQYTLRTETRVVEVGVVVRDSRSHAVGGLTRDDFEIEDGGKKRETTAFSTETSSHQAAASSGRATRAAPPAVDAPGSSAAPRRFVALLFDDLSMGQGDLVSTRKAAKKLLTEGLSAGDMVGIFFMSKGQILPFTDDVMKLNESLDKLTIATRSPALPSCPNLTEYDAYVIANRKDPLLVPVKVAEAVQCGLCPAAGTSCTSRVEYMATGVWNQIRFTSLNTLVSIGRIVDFMATLPGRRVVLMASSGFLSGTLEAEREEIVNRALHGGVVINALDAKGLYALDSGVSETNMNGRSVVARLNQGTSPQWESAAAMSILSASTGGLFFHNSNDLELGLKELGLVPEFSYSLAFVLPVAPDGRYHKLKVRLKHNSPYSLQARPGYFAAIIPAAPPAGERRIDQEAMSAGTLDEVPVSISAVAGNLPSGEPALMMVLHLDVAHLPFVKQAGRRTQKLTVVAALFDRAGNFVTGKECVMDFGLKENTFKLLAGGMDAAVTLTAPAGKYRLRGVVQDASDGKITASSLSAEIQ